MRVTLRPTVAADIARVFTEPLPYRVKSITALAGDKVIGLGGLGFRPDGLVIVFAKILPEARKYPAAIHRAGLAVMAMIRGSKLRQVVAEAEPGNPAAEGWLLRLGFERVQHNGTTVFVWRRENDAEHR